MLGEFGIAADANAAIVEEKKVEDEAVLASDQGADAAAKKKKKKPKKKSNKSSSAEPEDWVQVDAPESSKGEERSEPAVVDVAAVLKSKAKTKEKTVAEIAAATAAKEAKAKAAKKEAEEKKKVSLFLCRYVYDAFGSLFVVLMQGHFFWCVCRKRRRIRKSTLVLGIKSTRFLS